MAFEGALRRDDDTLLRTATLINTPVARIIISEEMRESAHLILLDAWRRNSLATAEKMRCSDCQKVMACFGCGHQICQPGKNEGSCFRPHYVYNTEESEAFFCINLGSFLPGLFFYSYLFSSISLLSIFFTSSMLSKS